MILERNGVIVLEIKELSYLYNGKQGKGIKKIDLTGDDGMVIGVVGPNASGKSTLFKIMAGLINNTSGEIIYNDKALDGSNSLLLSYLDEDPYILEELSPIMFLQYVNKVKGMDMDEEKLYTMLEYWRLDRHINDSIKTFSLGMKKRVALAAVFIGDPKIIILDEPTNGLDTANVILLKNIIKIKEKEGSIIFVSNHVIDFISDIATKVVFLKNGEKVLDVKNKDIDLEKIYINLYMEERKNAHYKRNKQKL